MLRESASQRPPSQRTFRVSLPLPHYSGPFIRIVAMNLIVGATGVLGPEICRILREQGKPVRALVRTTSDPAKVGQLCMLGVRPVIGDLKDSASIRAAVAGVSTIVSSATAVVSQQAEDSLDAVDGAGQRALIEAAREAGVKHFIFVSVTGGITTSCALIDAKRETEEQLKASGLTWTILRPAAFMENWLGPMAGFDAPNRKATLLGDGNQKISYIAAADVARVAAGCVDNPRAANRVIDLGGPEAISPRDAVKEYERATGAAFEVQEVPVAALEAQYAAAQHPTQKSFAALMLAQTSSDVIPMTETAREFGLEQRTARDHISEAAGA